MKLKNLIALIMLLAVMCSAGTAFAADDLSTADVENAQKLTALEYGVEIPAVEAEYTASADGEFTLKDGEYVTWTDADGDVERFDLTTPAADAIPYKGTDAVKTAMVDVDTNKTNIVINAEGIKNNADGIVMTNERVDNNVVRLNSHDIDIAKNELNIQLNRDYTKREVARLDSRIDDLEDDMSEGIAMAMAMQAPGVSQGKRFNMSMSGGFYNGENALAGAAGVRLNESLQLNGAVGVGMRSGDIGGRVGATLEF